MVRRARGFGHAPACLSVDWLNPNRHSRGTPELERASEIGVRKAFGASSRTLAVQFIIENIILTFLGGVIGVVLSLIIIRVFNSTDLVPNLELSMNFTVLFIGIITCLVFGLMSGAYPAWRMSKMNVVNALKTK